MYIFNKLKWIGAALLLPMLLICFPAGAGERSPDPILVLAATIFDLIDPDFDSSRHPVPRHVPDRHRGSDDSQDGYSDRGRHPDHRAWNDRHDRERDSWNDRYDRSSPWEDRRSTRDTWEERRHRDDDRWNDQDQDRRGRDSRDGGYGRHQRHHRQLTTITIRGGKIKVPVGGGFSTREDWRDAGPAHGNVADGETSAIEVGRSDGKEGSVSLNVSKHRNVVEVDGRKFNDTGSHPLSVRGVIDGATITFAPHGASR